MGKNSSFFLLAIGLLFMLVISSCGSEGGSTTPPLAACSLTFNTPVAGSSYESGDPVNIRWDHEGSAETVTITLLQAGQLVGTIAASASNNGFFPWNADVMAGVGGDFSIRIVAQGQDACQTESGIIALANTSACDVALTTLLLPEMILVAGQDFPITWDSHDTMGDIGIELRHGHLNEVLVATITESTPDDGAFVWKVDSYNDAAHRDVTDDSIYWLRIFDLNVPGCEDHSTDFTLIDPDLCVIDVFITPGGAIIDEGTTVTIGINTHDYELGDMVKIRLYAGSVPVPGGYITPPGQDILASSFSYTWEVNDFGFIGGTLSNVRVIKVDDEYCWGKTANFAIRGTFPALGLK